MHVTIEQAEKAIQAARAKAVELGTQMCIAVVDSGGNLKAFHRMDGAWVGSIDIAQKKAKTSVFFGMKTGQIGSLSQPGGSLYGIEHSNQGLITFPGGIPIVDADGEMSGAIGVSGSSVENDDAVALAGASAIGDTGAARSPLAHLIFSKAHRSGSRIDALDVVPCRARCAKAGIRGRSRPRPNHSTVTDFAKLRG